MLYRVLRAAASIALRWYYADVVVLGGERIPRRGPIVLIANHPNALIDALLVGTVIRRRVLLTAKATIFGNPVLGLLLKSVGVVPLRRAKDEASRGATTVPARERNADSFRLVTSALEAGNAILVFPEGISHDAPSIAPLRSGASRMALQARAEGVQRLQIVPVGLVFEEKERPGSSIMVRVGEPLALDVWAAAQGASDVPALTAELDERLRAVTLNFGTAERAARAVGLAHALAALASAPAAVQEPYSLAAMSEMALRVDAATSALASAPADVVAAADSLTGRLMSIELDLARRGVSLADIRISVGLRSGAGFVLREAPIAGLALLVAALGQSTHWLPLRLARVLAIRSIGDDPSRDQPAMRTILYGVGLILVWYVMQGALLTYWRGPGTAALWLALIFSAAHADRLLRGRLQRAIQRARSYLAFRARPTLQGEIVARIEALLADALALEDALTEVPAGPAPSTAGQDRLVDGGGR